MIAARNSIIERISDLVELESRLAHHQELCIIIPN